MKIWQRLYENLQAHARIRRSQTKRSSGVYKEEDGWKHLFTVSTLNGNGKIKAVACWMKKRASASNDRYELVSWAPARRRVDACRIVEDWQTSFFGSANTIHKERKPRPKKKTPTAPKQLGEFDVLEI